MIVIPASVDHVAQIAVPHCIGRRCIVARQSTLTLTQAFIRSEPEKFVSAVCT
jgi:hypothetical protein